MRRSYDTEVQSFGARVLNWIKNATVAVRPVRSVQWCGVYLLFIIYFVALVGVHLFPDARVLSQLNKQYQKSERFAMDRTGIYDCRGEPLALSVTMHSVFMDPGVDGFDATTLANLVPFIGKSKVNLLKTKLHRRFYWVKRYLEYKEAQDIVKAGGKGFYIREEKKRIYPKGSILSHVLGFCDADGIGLSGVELTWNNTLMVPEKMHIGYRGASATVTAGDSLPLNDHEKGIFLTIDPDIQFAMEHFIGERAREIKPGWAAGVCLEVHTGAVKAIASYPHFDSNDRRTFANLKALRNNAVNRVYEPGSTFKPIMASIALENGTVRQNSRFRCPAYLKVADGIIRDSHPRDNGKMSLTQLIVKSSNVGMAQIGMALKPIVTYSEMCAWGFGRRTGIRLSGEEEGLFDTPDKWYGLRPANVAIGQGFALTPLQMVTAFNAIVNDGTLLRPYLVRSAVNSEGDEVFHSGPMEVTRVMSARHAKWMRGVLRKVVTDGTGRPVDSELVAVAGKTGTAQVARHGKYVRGLHHASMIGFWPANNPKYTMLIVFGDVTGKIYYGGAVTGPVFKNIVEEVERLKGRVGP